MSPLQFEDADDVTVDNTAGATSVHPGAHVEDVDVDLVVHFETDDADFESDVTEGTIVGVTTDGVKLFGSDSVSIVGGGGNGGGSGGGGP